MITDLRRADVFEHANRLEPQSDPLVRTHCPAAVWAVLSGRHDVSAMVVVARNLFLWLVHRRDRCARVDLLHTEGMSSLTSIGRLIPASTTVITPSFGHSAPLPDPLAYGRDLWGRSVLFLDTRPLCFCRAELEG